MKILRDYLNITTKQNITKKDQVNKLVDSRPEYNIRIDENYPVIALTESAIMLMRLQKVNYEGHTTLFFEKAI